MTIPRWLRWTLIALGAVALALVGWAIGARQRRALTIALELARAELAAERRRTEAAHEGRQQQVEAVRRQEAVVSEARERREAADDAAGQRADRARERVREAGVEGGAAGRLAEAWKIAREGKE